MLLRRRVELLLQMWVAWARTIGPCALWNRSAHLDHIGLRFQYLTEDAMAQVRADMVTQINARIEAMLLYGPPCYNLDDPYRPITAQQKFYARWWSDQPLVQREVGRWASWVSVV